MNRDLRAFLPGILAALFVVLIGVQTFHAHQRSGRTGARPKPRFTTLATDPYARLEQALSVPDDGAPIGSLRDPFAYGHATVARPTTGPKPKPAAPRPIVTAIVADPQDPRAIILYEGRNYTVRSGDLFDKFNVLSITAEGVVLDDGRERIVLPPPTKGR